MATPVHTYPLFSSMPEFGTEGGYMPDGQVTVVAGVEGKDGTFLRKFQVPATEAERAFRILSGNGKASGIRKAGFSKGEAIEVLQDAELSDADIGELSSLILEKCSGTSAEESRHARLNLALAEIDKHFRHLFSRKGEWAIPFKVLKDYGLVRNLPEFTSYVRPWLVDKADSLWEQNFKKSVQKFLNTNLTRISCNLMNMSIFSELVKKAGPGDRMIEIISNLKLCKDIDDHLHRCRII